METTIKRRATTVRLPDYLLADLHTEAKRHGMSVSRFIERMAEDTIYHTPNAETLAAIEEARSGVEMDELDLSSFENFLKSFD